MSVFKIDFEDIPYDLFQLLNLNSNCSTKDVKKAYKKAVIKYHPDKNHDIDDEYFSWISLANKILSNKEHRELYIEWKEWKDNHTALKDTSRKNIKINDTKSYKEFEKELNTKHGYVADDTIITSGETRGLINKLMNERNKVIIPKERISNINSAVDNLKKDTTKLETHNQELIRYSGEVMSLQSKSMYGALDDIGKLYGENELVTNKNMTSFNYAFNLNEYQEFKEDKSSLEDRIKEYNRQTETIKKEQKKKFKKKKSL